MLFFARGVFFFNLRLWARRGEVSATVVCCRLAFVLLLKGITMWENQKRIFDSVFLLKEHHQYSVKGYYVLTAVNGTVTLGSSWQSHRGVQRRKGSTCRWIIHLTVNLSPFPPPLPSPSPQPLSLPLGMSHFLALVFKNEKVWGYRGSVNTLILKEYMNILKNYLASQFYKWLFSEKAPPCL